MFYYGTFQQLHCCNALSVRLDKHITKAVCKLICIQTFIICLSIKVPFAHKCILCFVLLYFCPNYKIIVPFSLFLVVVVSVAIPVAIAVTVAISVSVTAAAAMGPVEYHGKTFEALGVIYVLQLFEHFAVQQAGADDEECAVAVFLKNMSVGDNVNGRAINEDVVISLAHCCNESIKMLAANKFGGVGRWCANSDDMQVVVFCVCCYYAVDVACTAR